MCAYAPPPGPLLDPGCPLPTPQLPIPPHPHPYTPSLPHPPVLPPGQRGGGCGWIGRRFEWDGGSSWGLAASSCWCMVVYALQKVSSAAKLHPRGLPGRRRRGGGGFVPCTVSHERRGSSRIDKYTHIGRCMSLGGACPSLCPPPSRKPQHTVGRHANEPGCH